MPVYLDESKPVEQRIDDALSRMTLDEKIAVIHAQSKFSSPGVKRLGFPDFWTDDGPHGVRPDVLWDEWEQAEQTNDSCVAFPALTCLAATWNPQMARLYGESLGEEALYRGKGMILGNIPKGLASMDRVDKILLAWREHLPHASWRPQLRVYGRGSLAGIAHGGALYPGAPV